MNVTIVTYTTMATDYDEVKEVLEDDGGSEEVEVEVGFFADEPVVGFPVLLVPPVDEGEGRARSCGSIKKETPFQRVLSIESKVRKLCITQGLILNDRGFSFERNCVLRRWESETLKWIINHKFDKVN